MNMRKLGLISTMGCITLFGSHSGFQLVLSLGSSEGLFGNECRRGFGCFQDRSRITSSGEKKKNNISTFLEKDRNTYAHEKTVKAVGPGEGFRYGCVTAASIGIAKRFRIDSLLKKYISDIGFYLSTRNSPSQKDLVAFPVNELPFEDAVLLAHAFSRTRKRPTSSAVFVEGHIERWLIVAWKSIALIGSCNWNTSFKFVPLDCTIGVKHILCRMHA